jgi:hypothetical protein
MEVGMMETFKYLQKKSMVLNQNQYGPVKYLLSYAACGNRVNFYNNDLAGKVRWFKSTEIDHRAVTPRDDGGTQLSINISVWQ